MPPDDDVNPWRDDFYANWLKIRNRIIRKSFKPLARAWQELEGPNFDPPYPNPLWSAREYAILHPDSEPFNLALACLSPIFTAPFSSDYSAPVLLSEVDKKLLQDSTPRVYDWQQPEFVHTTETKRRRTG